MKFLDLLGLTEFLINLKETFSQIGHKHTVSDLSDYMVDESFSATSTNPIQNKTVNNALLTIANDIDDVEELIDNHKNDIDNPHQIIEKIKANSDLVITELENEISGEDPELDPIVSAKIAELQNDIDEINEKIENGEIGGSGGVSSWNDLTDKPFDETKQYTITIDEITVNCSEATGNAYKAYNYDEYFNQDVLLDIESTFSILWDGVMYDVDYDGISSLKYGNKYLYDSSEEDNGIPFCITVLLDDYVQVVGIAIYAKTQGEHTLALYNRKTTVKTLDPKFIKDMYYSTTQYVEEHEEVTLNCSTPSGNGYTASCDSINPEIGTINTIIWDGVEYANNTYGNYVYSCGNPYLADSNEIDNGMPFYITGWLDLDFTMLFYTTIYARTEGMHTISCGNNIETVKTIDPKYIPDGITGGASTMDELTAVDTSGFLGSIGSTVNAQTLINDIMERIASLEALAVELEKI